MAAKHRTQGPGFVAEEVAWRGHRVSLQVATVGYPESMAEAVAQRKACHDTLDSALAALNAEPALRSQVERLRGACRRALIVLSDPNSATTDEIWDGVVVEVRRALAETGGAS